MSDINNTHGLLDLIKSIASNRESGRLEINSSGAQGALLFTDGKLVDARLGSLEGFQAVNAAVSLPGAQFGFVHATYPPHSGTIGPNERLVLSRFFGIEAAEIDEAHANPDAEVDWNMMPEQVVPLAEVEEMPQDDFQDTPTIEARPIAAPVLEEVPVEAPVIPEATVIRRNNAHAFTLPRARVALYLALILAVTAAVAIALRSRLNAHRQVASAATSVESKPQPSPESSPVQVKGESVASSETQVKQATSRASSVSQQRSTPVRSESPSVAVNAKQRDESEERHVNAHNLAGEWKVINTVQKTAYKSFDKMEVGFRLRIKQTGKDFTATGVKFSENGRNLPQNSRTPIQVTGSIDGDKIVATFVEDGLMRRTNGRFVWKLQNGGGLTGTFASTAANSSGKSAAIRQP